MLKDSFLHLPVFLILFIAVFAVTLFLSVLAAWTGVYNPVFPLEAGWGRHEIALNSGDALLGSIFIALYLLFLRIGRKPGNRFFSLLFPLAASYIVLLAGVTAVYGPPGSPAPREYETLVPFIPGTIHTTGTELIYVDEVSVASEAAGNTGLENVVRYGGGGLAYYRRAQALVRKTGEMRSTVVLPEDGSQSPVIVEPANPVYEPAFEAPGVLVSLVDDIRLVNRFLLEERSESPGTFTFTAFSILLAAAGCVCFIRVTRWPLFNALFTLAAFRGLLFVMRFLESDIGRDLQGMITNQTANEMFAAFVFLALGVLFTAIHFVFPGKQRG